MSESSDDVFHDAEDAAAAVPAPPADQGDNAAVDAPAAGEALLLPEVGGNDGPSVPGDEVNECRVAAADAGGQEGGDGAAAAAAAAGGFADGGRSLLTHYDEHPGLETAARLFAIERSKNKNTVLYEANLVRVTESADEVPVLDKKTPVTVTWIRLSDDDCTPEHATRKGLGWAELKFAYGASAKAKGDGHFDVTLTAFNKRKLDVFLDDAGKPHAHVTIDGQVGRLSRIYVEAHDRSIGLPKVDYIELIGTSIDGDARMLYERINA